jgi:heptosyltransferase I
MKRVCVVMLSAIGDTVHTLPVLTALKRHDPSTHITWIIQPGPATLVDGHPAVDRLVLFDRRRGWDAFLAGRRAGPFDTLIDLQVYFKAGLITALTPAPIKLGFDRARARDLNFLFTNTRIPPRPARAHMQDQYLEFLSFLGVPAQPVAWNLGPRPDERAWQREFVKPYDRPIVPLVIGSTRPGKDWVAERWAALADALYEDHGLAPVMVGGDSYSEQETARQIAERVRTPIGNALGSGLRRLVSILDAAALVVSLDTGPLHMAVALDRPVISLIAYNDPVIYGPYAKFQDLIVSRFGEPARRGMARIEVRDVLERVDIWRSRYRS